MSKVEEITLDESSILLAFSLSKQTVIDEIQDKMLAPELFTLNIAEFNEFLCRFAHLLFIDNQPLPKKLERLLTLLCPLIKTSAKILGGDEEIESESDYDDDFVEECIQKALRKR